jgi:SAM-dependent methyltransferase
VTSATASTESARWRPARAWELVNRNIRSQLSLNRKLEFATLCTMLELRPRDSLLDIGSGDGYWTERFAQRAGRVTGLEPDETVLRHARALRAGPNIMYAQGVAEALPFADGAFDRVVSVSSVEHFRDPVKGLEEMFRVLRPGGRLAISVDTLTRENSSPAFRRWHRQRHHVTTYFREDELASILTAAGFCVDGTTVHMFCSPLSRRAREMFIRRPRLLLPLFPLFRALVALGDAAPSRAHGQIVALAAVRPAADTSRERR